MAAKTKKKLTTKSPKKPAKKAVLKSQPLVRADTKPPKPAAPVTPAKPAPQASAAALKKPTPKMAIELLTEIKSADALLKQGKTDEAAAIGKSIVAKHPDLAAGHNLLGRVYSKAGNLELAIEHLEKSAELEPGDNIVLERLVNFLIKVRNFDRAREVIGKILALGATGRSLLWYREKLTLLDRGGDDPFKSLVADPEILWETGQYLAKRPLELLKLPGFRTRLGRQRRLDLAKTRDVKLLDETDNIIHNAVVHNYDYIATSSDDGARPNLLINPLCAIDYVNTNAANMKVLTVGPRSETELFCLMAAGFQLDNITGVDLISFSPLIESGDMHALPYPDSSFDIVIAGWVLAYSKNNTQAAAELLRVAKPNAYVAIGCAYTPPERGRREEDREGKNIVGTRFSDVQDILQHFEPHIKQVYFRGEVERERRKGTAAVTTVFQVKADY